MEMPDLPIEQKSVEQRKVIQFWINHSSVLEKKLLEAQMEIHNLRAEISRLQVVANYE